MYADYEFYKTEYYGGVIPEDSFPKFAELASDHLDIITFGRLENGLPTDEKAAKRVKKAVCAVAEALYYINQVRAAGMEGVGNTVSASGQVTGKTIKSKTAGQESVTYENGTGGTDIYSRAATDKATETALIFSTAREYLSGVTTDQGISLLYAGM